MKIFNEDVWSFLLEQNTLVEVKTSEGVRYFLGYIELPDSRTPFVSINGVEVTKMLQGNYTKKAREGYMQDLEALNNNAYQINFSQNVDWISYSKRTN